MAGRGAPKAIVPSVARRCRSCRQAGLARSDARAASDRLALSQHVTPPAARPRTLPDGKNIGGEVSFLNLPLASHHSITSSARIEIEAMFVYGRRGQSASPLPVALVEGRRRAQPGTPDTLGARKAKVLHQVNQALAQSKIRRRPVDRFYTCHFDLRQGRCRGFGHPHRRRLLRVCCKRPCRSHASEQADELAAPPHSITSSARARNDSGMVSPSALAVVRLTTSSNLVGCSTGMSPGFAPRRILST